MEKLAPICACCRDKIHTAWQVWAPDAYVTCGNPLCTGWAESRGFRLAQRGLVELRKGPMRPRGKPRCSYCGKERPPKRECFELDGMLMCSLSCKRRAERVGR